MSLQSLLSELCNAPGVSGHESAIALHIADWFRPYCDEAKTDALGNLHAVRRGEGSGPTVMFAAHMDEIGLMVSGITDSGFLRVTPVGGSDVRTLLGQDVWVHGKQILPGVVGSKPPHLLEADERRKLPGWDDLYVDIGLDRSDAARLVQVGDVISVRRELTPVLTGRYFGKALDNRVSVAVMWEALRRLTRIRHQAHVVAVATVQEEVGLRGATTSAFAIEPQVAIAIDVGFAKQPGGGDEAYLELGDGPAITLGPNIHPGLRQDLIQIAKSHRIPYQVEVAPAATGTDAWAIQVSAAGVPTALLSIPLRHMHSPGELVDPTDVEQAGRLLAAFVAELDYDRVEGWQHALS